MTEWCTIESDPGVFTELLALFGARHVVCEDIPSLDGLDFSPLGLVFLFRWVGEGEEGGTSGDGEPVDPAEAPVFFAQQTVPNACATQALLAVLLNRRDCVDLGPMLTQFCEFGMALDAETRGHAIGQQEELRIAHNSFARPVGFEIERPDDQQGEAFHFVAYVPCAGAVWELDGLSRAPVRLGPVPASGWVELATAAITRRISAYSSGELLFNLLGLRADPLPDLRRRLEESSLAQPRDDSLVGALGTQVGEIEEQREAWRKENERRRHNFFPMVLAMLQAMAESGTLDEAVQQGRDRTRQQLASAESRRRARKRERS